MAMLDIHAVALDSKMVSYHEFLSRYSRTKRIVYGFVEGKEDPCFYRGFIENQIPVGWDLELWPTGNKHQIYQIHSTIDWRRFPKKRICFFVDRDLSDMIPERLTKDTNIYVTDGYSIENDVVTRGTCLRILTEICGFANVAHEELDKIGDLFELELGKFLVEMKPIMAWILSWRRAKKSVGLNDILMRDLFYLTCGGLRKKACPKGKSCLAEYIHGQCNLQYERGTNIAVEEAEFDKENIYRRFTRGKYVFWFLIEFCRSIRVDAKTICGACAKVSAMKVSLSTSNGISVVGNRARIPNSLRSFLDTTFCDYIAREAA